MNGEDVDAEVIFGPGEIRYRPYDKMWYRCDAMRVGEGRASSKKLFARKHLTRGECLSAH